MCFKVILKRDKMTWRSLKFLLFSSFSKPSWLKEGWGRFAGIWSQNSWICYGLTFHKETSQFISLQQLDTEFSFLLGRELRKIQRFLAKSRKNPLSVPLQDPASPIPWADPMEFWHPIPVFPKFPTLQRTGGSQFRSWTTWNNSGMIPDVFPGSPTPAGFLPGHGSSQSK